MEKWRKARPLPFLSADTKALPLLSADAKEWEKASADKSIINQKAHARLGVHAMYGNNSKNVT